MARLQDANARVVLALPAAAASATSAALDLKTNGLPIGPVGAGLGLHIQIDACPNLVDAKTVTVTMKHCATVGGSYVPIPGVGNIGLLGAGGVGAAALELEIYLPPHTLGFVKATVDVLTAGGDNTASNLTVSARI